MNKHFDKPEFYVQRAADVLVYKKNTQTTNKINHPAKNQQLLEQKD